MRSWNISGRFGWLLIAFLFAMPAANGQIAAFGNTTQIFPQFATGASWATYIMLHNSAQQPELVTVELFRSDGSVFLSRVIALGPAQTQTFSIEPTPEITVGWARLSANDRFTATLLFQFADSGRVISEASVLPVDPLQDFKVIGSAHLERGVTTGIALANPSPTNSAIVTARRLNADGVLVGTAAFTLGPLQHLSKFINEEPLFPGIDNYDGIIEVSASQPVAAVGLRFDGFQLATLNIISPHAD